MKNWPIFLLISVSFYVKGQERSLDTLVNRFSKHREEALQEKIYAHLDRNFYLTGETLWFSIVTVDGTLHKPIDVSKVAYAEILDKGNFAVLQAKVEIRKGFGEGSFFLPASLSSGSYRLRIYTSWMKNFDPEFYFDEAFSIVNPFIAAARPDARPAGNKVAFFPEGGSLVAGIQSKIAFRTTDEYGRGINCRGIVVDNAGDTISTFSGSRFGMGHFWFTPSDHRTYRVLLVDPSGKSTSHSFPTVYPGGYVMQLRDSGDHIDVRVFAKGVQESEVFLFVHARQQITSALRQELSNNRATIRLKKNDLHEGISHFTLFDGKLRPVCERLYFTYPGKKLDIRISGNAKVYGTRSRVVLSLQTAKDAQTPAAAKLSLSVYKTDSVSSSAATPIYPYLWLASDLTGEVESPEFYFNNPSEEVAAAMDNLMLTHGWRRFSWEDILRTKKSFTYLPEVSGHIVRGVVTQDGERQRGIFTYLGTPGKIIRAYGSWSSAIGEVKFEIKDFYGPRRIIVRTKTDSTRRHSVTIDDPFSTRTDNDQLPPLALNPTYRQELLARSIAMQVQDIYYAETDGNRLETPVVDSTAFFGVADNTYYLDDYTRFPVMEEVMREYVPGVFVRKRKDGFHFMVVDEANGGVLPGDPMVLIDGVPVFDVDDIMKIDPLRVRKLEVVKRQYYLGQAAFSGIVSYSTYNGDLGGLELDPGTVTLDYDGLQLRRQFHAPHYSRTNVNDRMPDQRYLLHWAPQITTDREGKQTAYFYTSDVPGLYKVVVHGLSDDGWSGSQTLTFNVRTTDSQ